MMIAVTILAVGIILVLRSLLNSVSVLDYIQNRITAICFLESKMNALEQTMVEEEGVKTGSIEEETLVGNRKALFKSEIENLEMEEVEEGEPIINEVRLKISWQEGEKNKDASLVTYFPGAEE